MFDSRLLALGALAGLVHCITAAAVLIELITDDHRHWLVLMTFAATSIGIGATFLLYGSMHPATATRAASVLIALTWTLLGFLHVAQTRPGVTVALASISLLAVVASITAVCSYLTDGTPATSNETPAPVPSSPSEPRV